MEDVEEVVDRQDRYQSLCLHDPVWYDHLPYIPFPDHWPIFSPKDKIADWLEMYTRVMELNYWGSTFARHAVYDAEAAEWKVEVEREGEPVTLRPKHLVFATGVSGFPVVPTLPGAVQPVAINRGQACSNVPLQQATRRLQAACPTSRRLARRCTPA